VDFHRRKNRQKRWGFFAGAIRLDDPSVEIADPATLIPDTEIDTASRRRILHAALASLPPNQRTAFLLSKYDELSYDEIAGIMNLSVSAVTALIHRAKNNLHKRLSQYYEDFL
jgi:RNA polymerase sigma-70 factor (ECF subfamily)